MDILCLIMLYLKLRSFWECEEVILEEYFPKEEVNKARRIFYVFHGRLLLDSEISDTDTLLLCIYMLSNKNKTSKVKYQDAKSLFAALGRNEDNFRKFVHYLRKKGMIDRLEENSDVYLSLKFDGLKRVKMLLGEEVGIRTWFIQAGKVYSGKRFFEEEVISKLDGEVKICDPYCGVGTLDILAGITEGVKIYLLTQVIEDKEKFKRYLTHLTKEKPNIKIEVRIHSKSKLHDRYILCKDQCWSVGHSLKDLGKKDTIITQLGEEVINALHLAFNVRWKEAIPL